MTGRSVEFAEYYAARYQVLRRTAYLLSGSWHDAEDLTQTAFVRLYLVWRRVRADGAHAYARQVLVNEFLQARRRRRAEPVAELDDLPARDGGSTEDRVLLAGALRGVPRQQRAVVVLRYWEGLSIGQTAQLLGMAEGSVKSQAARGLAALRAHLEAGQTTGAGSLDWREELR